MVKNYLKIIEPHSRHIKIAIDCHIPSKIRSFLPPNIKCVHRAGEGEMDSLWVMDARRKGATVIVSGDYDIMDLADRHGFHCIHIEQSYLKSSEKIAKIVMHEVKKVSRQNK